MGLDTKTYWLIERQSQCDFDFKFELLGQLRVAVVRSEKLVAEAGDSSGTQRNVRRWKPLPSNG
jgi:hypothetical protein